MELAHHLAPQADGGVVQGRAQPLLLVVARPHHRGVVGRVTREPQVLPAGGGARLARHGHAVKPTAGASAAGGHDALEHGVHIPRGGLLKHRMGLWLVVQQDLAVGIQHLGVGAGLNIHAVPGKGGVGGRHLPDRHTVGQAAQGQGGDVDVGVGLAVDLLGLHQSGDAEAVLAGQVLIGQLRGAVVGHDLDRHGIDRALEGVGHHSQAPVAGGRVDGPAARPAVVVRRVVNDSGGGDESHVDGRSVDRQGLDGGAGGPDRLGRPIENQAALLLPHAAGEGGHIAGGVVDHHDGGLELLPVVGDVGQVVQVFIHTVNRGLGFGVKGGIHRQAAAVEHLLDVLLRPAVAAVHQILNHVPDHLVLEPGIHHLGLAGVLAPDKDQLLGHRRVVLLLADVTLIQHLIEDVLLAVLVALDVGHLFARLRVGDDQVQVGVIDGGVVGDADQAGALGQRQLGDVLAEILIGGRIDAPAVLPQIDIIQVPLQGLLLGVVAVKVQRPEDLQDLPLHRHLVLLSHIFDELLGDGGAALDIATGEHGEHSSGGPEPVHAVVVVKPLVLDGHRRMDQVFRDIRIGHPFAVLVPVDGQPLHVRAGVRIRVIDGGGQVHGKLGQVQRRLRHDDRLDVDGRKTGQDGAGGDADEQQRAQYLQNIQGDLCSGGPFPAPPAGTCALGRVVRLCQINNLRSRRCAAVRSYTYVLCPVRADPRSAVQPLCPHGGI